jgi:hypothetical protein
MADPKESTKKTLRAKAQTHVPAVIKKVKPYPFKAALDLNGVKRNVDVVYLGQTGFIANLGAQFVNVGEHYQAAFELPVLKEFVSTPVRVLKTYDKALEPTSRQVQRVAEFHFEKLSEDHRACVTKFMVTIGQAK